MLTIESRDGWHRATIEEGDDGVTVVILARTAPWVEIHRDTVDAPFHVVRDKIADLVDQLPPPQVARQRRDHVLSVDGRNVFDLWTREAIR